MNKTINTKDMAITALLIALGIIIPILFTFLRVILPPAFTATLTAHVPIFIAMFVSPVSAVLTAIGTTLGFLLTGLDPIVTARAGSHIVFAVVGAYMIHKNASITLVGIVTTLLHALCEAIVVLLFLSMNWTKGAESSIFEMAFYVTGIGTILHHIIDYVIAIVIVKALAKTRMLKQIPRLF